MTNERVYVLVAVDKEAVLDSLAASTTVKACLRDVWFEDTFAVADVTDLLDEDGVVEGPHALTYFPKWLS